MEINFILITAFPKEVLEAGQKMLFFYVSKIFTDVNSTRNNFVNTDKPCRKKARSSKKLSTGKYLTSLLLLEIIR